MRLHRLRKSHRLEGARLQPRRRYLFGLRLLAAEVNVGDDDPLFSALSVISSKNRLSASRSSERLEAAIVTASLFSSVLSTSVKLDALCEAGSPFLTYDPQSGSFAEPGRNVRIADATETISLWLNTHVLSTADSAFNRLLSDSTGCCDR
jgi:hypothetical protein